MVFVSINEYLSTHRGQSDRKCALCGAECEGVVHVLWEVQLANIICMVKLRESSK